MTWLSYILSIATFVLTVLLVVRIIRGSGRTGSILAWLLAIVFVPYVGIPAYLIFGGRKLERLAREKDDLYDRQLTTHVEPDELHPIEEVLRAFNVPPARPGNQIEFLGNGEDVYRRLIKLIEGAERRIHVMTFILGKDEVGEAIIRALATRASDGVDVRFLLDAYGGLMTRGRFLDPLREAGGEVGVFMRMISIRRRWSANLRNHRKIIVVDGETAIVSGMNLADEYLGPEPDPDRWIDSAVVVRGPVVADLDAIFASDWKFSTNRSVRSALLPPEVDPDRRATPGTTGPEGRPSVADEPEISEAATDARGDRSDAPDEDAAGDGEQSGSSVDPEDDGHGDDRRSVPDEPQEIEGGTRGRRISFESGSYPELDVAPYDAGGALVQVVASGPDVHGDPLADAALMAIMNARERIWLVTPYFLPDDVVFRALVLRARVGIDVRVLVPYESNHLLADLARGPLVRRLHEAGGKIYAYEPRMMHAKMMIFDDDLVAFGSANLDQRSLYLNYEVGLFVYDETHCRTAIDWFDSLAGDCRTIGDHEVSGTREWLEDIGRLFAPLL